MAPDTERDDSEFDESGDNLTQQRMDDADVPLDASWDEGDFGELEEDEEPVEDDEQ